MDMERIVDLRMGIVYFSLATPSRPINTPVWFSWTTNSSSESVAKIQGSAAILQLNYVAYAFLSSMLMTWRFFLPKPRNNWLPTNAMQLTASGSTILSLCFSKRCYEGLQVRNSTSILRVRAATSYQQALENKLSVKSLIFPVEINSYFMPNSASMQKTWESESTRSFDLAQGRKLIWSIDLLVIDFFMI